MSIEAAAVAPPARAKLLAHIRANYGTIPAFCEATNLPRFKVQKAINGKLKRCDVDFAYDLQEATGGHVTVPDWRSGKKTRVKRRKRRGAQ